MVSYVLVLWELDKFVLLDFGPRLGPAFRSMATFLLGCHVRSADPVLVFCLTLQMHNHVALHLPRDGPGTPVLPNPLLSRDAFPQKNHGEEHGEV